MKFFRSPKKKVLHYRLILLFSDMPSENKPLTECAAASVYIAPGSRSTVTQPRSVSHCLNPKKMKFS